MTSLPHTNVDIIIPTRGRAALIDVTIESIRCSSYPHFKLWVVDQSDDHATEAAVARHTEVDPRVCYLRSAARGSSLARNEGVAAGHYPYILFTDDDCRVDPEWVTAMTAELADPATWAVFGRVIPDETYHPDMPAGAIPVSPALGMAVKDTPRRQLFKGNRFRLDFGHGANMGFRRDAYQRLGGFDPLLGVGGPLGPWEERDIGYRILTRGGRIVYTPDALAHHRHWRNWAGVRRAYRNYASGTGAAVSKYLRAGDLGGSYLLLEWLLDQGLRQVLSGVLKWQSRQKVEIGLLQLIYPWVGLWGSRRYPVDKKQVLYRWSPAPAVLPDAEAAVLLSNVP